VGRFDAYENRNPCRDDRGVRRIVASARQPAVKRLDGSAISPEEIDRTVLRLMRAAEVTGVGISIFDHGKVGYLKAYGFRDTQKKLPLTKDSVMAGASFTKVVFAYLTMQLVDDGILDLDKPVQAYLPTPLPDYPAYRDLAADPATRRSRRGCCSATPAASQTFAA